MFTKLYIIKSFEPINFTVGYSFYKEVFVNSSFKKKEYIVLRESVNKMTDIVDKIKIKNKIELELDLNSFISQHINIFKHMDNLLNTKELNFSLLQKLQLTYLVNIKKEYKNYDFNNLNHFNTEIKHLITYYEKDFKTLI